MKAKINKKKELPKKKQVPKKVVSVLKHHRGTDKLKKLSFITQIKIILVILIVVLFIISLCVGYSDTRKQSTIEDKVLFKLSQNKQVSISSYKQYMIGHVFINQMNNSDDYVIIYPEIRIIYDYKNDYVKSVSFINQVING